jgi:hypothetical protein
MLLIDFSYGRCVLVEIQAKVADVRFQDVFRFGIVMIILGNVRQFQAVKVGWGIRVVALMDNGAAAFAVYGLHDFERVAVGERDRMAAIRI